MCSYIAPEARLVTSLTLNYRAIAITTAQGVRIAQTDPPAGG